MLLWTQLERSKEIENDNTVVIKDLGVDAELRPEKKIVNPMLRQWEEKVPYRRCF